VENARRAAVVDDGRLAVPSPLAFARKLAAFLAVPLILSACAGTSSDNGTEVAAFRAVFSTVYQETAEAHIDPVDLTRFTQAGFQGIAGYDPELSVEYDSTSYTFLLNGDDVRDDDFPDSDATPGEWAAHAVEAVLSVRTESTIVEGASFDSLSEAFFDFALRTLDRYSRYANPDDAEQLRAERVGYGGIGIMAEPGTDGVTIVQVEPSEPADAAGLIVGDHIRSIDGESVEGLSVGQIESLLRGPIDTPVVLVIERASLPDALSVTVGRTQIVPNTVFYSVSGNHAVIRISGFNERTSKRVAEAVGRGFSELDGDLAGFILDLRGNLGGLLDQAVDTADLFLADGMISIADGRHPESHQRFAAEPGEIANGLPITVLINGASASAAEIVAAALQDQGRAVLIGMSTFGKGSIQTVVELPNGGELFLTWARFVAPSGYPLERLGVMPSICTSDARDAVQTLNDGLSDGPLGGAQLLSERRRVELTDEDAVRASLEDCPWIPHTSGDIDQTLAEMLLDSPALYRRAVAAGRMTDGS